MSLSSSSRSYLVDKDNMVTSMTKEIDLYWSAVESNDGNKLCSIHKVPQHILEVDRNSYEPIVLSIGPYHHGAPNLSAMEIEKWKCLDFIAKLNCEVSLQDYIRAISTRERQARCCYSQKITMDKMKFVQMLLLDSCFILVKVDGTVLTAMQLKKVQTDVATGIITDKDGEECLNSAESLDMHCSKQEHASQNLVHEIELAELHGNQIESKSNTIDHAGLQSDYNSSGDWYANATWHDLFLLENQMPFFIVEMVYNLALGNWKDRALIRDKIVQCVEDILRQFPKGVKECNKPKEFHHLLHLCHIYLRPTQKCIGTNPSQSKVRLFYHLVHLGQMYFNVGPKQQDNEQLQLLTHQKDCFQDNQLPIRWRQAVQYDEAGVQLNKRQYSTHDRHSLLDIKLNNGVLEVPCLSIDENTESLFKNLIAFEQMDSQYENYITAYIAFMSQLISTSEDATLLTQRGIIVHMLDNDDEVSAMFTRLSTHLIFGSDTYHYLQTLSYTLEAHYQSRLNRWIAWLWRNHLSNPWLVLGALAAVIVLVCTIVQTIFTVLAYTHPHGW